MPSTLAGSLRDHVDKTRKAWLQKDEEFVQRASLPFAFARKYPRAVIRWNDSECFYRAASAQADLSIPSDPALTLLELVSQVPRQG